jgi:hypothetical protein
VLELLDAVCAEIVSFDCRLWMLDEQWSKWTYYRVTVD